jgi:hypothetical protein
MKQEEYNFNLKNTRIIYNINNYTSDGFSYYEKILQYSINFVKNQSRN